MALTDRLESILIGIVIGFVLGYLTKTLREIKQELDEVDNKVSEMKDDKGAISFPAWRDALLMIVVFATAYAAILSQRASNDIEQRAEDELIGRCEAGVDSRNVQRSLVDAVYDLATTIAAPSLARADELSVEDIREYNAFVREVNAFRSEQYDMIKPSEVCRPYVADESVNPPTEPFPTIPNR